MGVVTGDATYSRVHGANSIVLKESPAYKKVLLARLPTHHWYYILSPFHTIRSQQSFPA